MLYALCFLLFVIGLYCAVTKKNMIKIVIGILVMEYAVNLFLIMLGYRSGGTAPIVEPGQLEPVTGQISAGFLNSSVEVNICKPTGLWWKTPREVKLSLVSDRKKEGEAHTPQS